MVEDRCGWVVEDRYGFAVETVAAALRPSGHTGVSVTGWSWCRQRVARYGF